MSFRIRNPKIRLHLAADFFIGLLWFGVEFSFLIVLQGFLISLGFMENLSGSLPDFYPRSFVGNLIILVVFGGIRSFITGLRQYFQTFTSQLFIGESRKEIFSLSFHQSTINSHKEVIANFSDVSSQAGSFVVHLGQCLQGGVTSVLLLGACFWIAWKETLIGLAILGVLYFPLRLFARKNNAYGLDLNDGWKESNAVLINGLKNHFYLRIHSLVSSEVNRGRGFIDVYINAFRGYAVSSAFLLSLPQFLGIVDLVIVSIISQSYFETDPKVLVAFFYLFVRFAQSASQCASYFSYLQLTKVAYLELNKFLDSQRVSDNRTSKKMMESADFQEIRCQKLSVGYNQNSPVLEKIEFSLKRGELVLVKGPSGSGKTTLLRTILGDLKPVCGSVMVNGSYNVSEIQISSCLGYVGPEAYLLNASVRSNLLFGNLNPVSDKKIYEVLSHLDLLSVIEKLPQKLDEILNDEIQLSAGQKQRLAFARAVLREPAILVLDESTANLDSITELRIIHFLENFKAETAIFAISHKDSFDSLADKIINV